MVFLGRMIDDQKDYGDRVADGLDEEIGTMIDQSYEIAKDILVHNKAKLIQIAERLMTEETLEGEALAAVFNEPLPSEQPAAEPAKSHVEGKGVGVAEEPSESPAARSKGKSRNSGVKHRTTRPKTEPGPA
jgi:cell division protease FtsH